MTQSHKSHQTLQVLTKKSFRKWKRKTIVLKKSAENQSQRTGELHIQQPFRPKTKKFATIIQLSPHSHAVIQGLSEDGKQNILGLLNLQGGDNGLFPCHFFYASTEQEACDLQELADTIQEICEVSTFTVDVESTNGRVPAGPAYLHFSNNRLFLSSKGSTITIRKEWQFHSLQTFRFEVRGIHIYDTVDNSQEEIFVSCRSKEDNYKIQQIISLQCKDCHHDRIPAIPTVHQPVLQRQQIELPVLPSSPTSSMYSCSSSPISSETQSIAESLFSHDLSSIDIRESGLLANQSKSTIEVKKVPLIQTQSSPLFTRRTVQSPKHSVKEHVDIRYPTSKRSKSVSDLRSRSIGQELVKPQLRAFSLDSNEAYDLRQKCRTNNHEWVRSFNKNDKRQERNTRESNSDVNNNAEYTVQGTGLDTCQKKEDIVGAQASLLPKCEPNTDEPRLSYGNYDNSTCVVMEHSSPSTHYEPKSGPVYMNHENNGPTNSPHYVNFESRPNCYMYRNISCLDDAPEVPKTYVNVFSGSSIKGCYENCHSGMYDHEFVYSSIDEVFDTPPPLPQPRRPPPRLPPRVNKGDSHREMYPGKNSREMHQKSAPVVPQRPPKIPPKPSKISAENKVSLQPQSDISSAADIQATPKIQVALFASPPTSGLVWFLRVAFMHQDENNTTFKRVTGIEEASHHKLEKCELLEVFTDINVTVNLQTKGFDLINESQQEVESSDIDNLRKGDWFVLEFRIKQSDQNQVQFDGEISVGPKAKASRGRASKVSFYISENFLIKSPLSPTEPPTSKPLKINFSRYERLCKALDPITNSSQDWRHVADALDFTRDDIQSLVSKYHRNVNFSPTDAILQSWEQRDPNCSLKRLVNILREVERFDVVQDLGYSIEPEEKLNDGFKKI